MNVLSFPILRLINFSFHFYQDIAEARGSSTTTQPDVCKWIEIQILLYNFNILTSQINCVSYMFALTFIHFRLDFHTCSHWCSYMFVAMMIFIHFRIRFHICAGWISYIFLLVIIHVRVDFHIFPYWCSYILVLIFTVRERKGGQFTTINLARSFGTIKAHIPKFGKQYRVLVCFLKF